MTFLFHRSGQSLIEYMIIVALVSVGSIGVMRVVGSNVAIQFENINRGLGSKNESALQLQNTDSSLLNKKDLSNFLQGTR